MLAARENSKTPLQSKVVFSDTVQIPVRKEYVGLTGSYDLAVFLNQIVFSNKEELTINDIRRLSLYDSTKQTLRKKLDKLVEEGLISKRRYGMYGRYFYKPANDIYPEDNSILALIEGLDLRNHPCYLTASILNKFRQFALSNIDNIKISANELKNILGTEKSASLIRLILRRLVKHGYLKESLDGVVYRYIINVQKLTNIFNPEVLEEQSRELLNIFSNYKESISLDVTLRQKSSWRLSFKRMLAEGYSFAVLRHILAYIGLEKNNNNIPPVSTISQIKRKYGELSDISERQLSRRKASRYLYKLLNGYVVTRSENKASENQCGIEDHNIIDDTMLWQQAYDWVEKKRKNLQHWFFKSSAGVTDIDFDDYLNEAVLFTYQNLKKEHRNKKYDTQAIKYRLSDYMYKHRHIDKTITHDENNNNIIQFYGDDVSTIIDRVDISEAVELVSCENEAKVRVENLFRYLDERSVKIIKYYFGFEGKKYTLAEISAELNMTVSSIWVILNNSLKKLRKIATDPPD